MRKIIFTCLIFALLITLNSTVNSSIYTNSIHTDFDPLVDIKVTVELQTIRFLEDDLTEIFNKNIISNLLNIKTAITSSEPDLYVKVFINDIEFTSNVWYSSRYVYNPQWSATLNVPDESEFVDIKIQLFESSDGNNLKGIPCDISSNPDEYTVELIYSIKTGKWTGDDELYDPSGYGRVCGCDDGTIYQKDKDSELWFNIYQNDYDADTIPYWTEVNVYDTDPTIDNRGLNDDGDLIPIEWEYKWGYNPFKYDNHEKTDPDKDSINNVEEYLTSEWYSDPFRKDVFVEMDIMEEGPNGEKTYFPEVSKELITTAFNRQNIVFHLDMGEMGGYDIVPFDYDIRRSDLKQIYNYYFLHGEEKNWRRGVFHYGVVVYYVNIPGYMFRSNSFQIASEGMEKKSKIPSLQRDIVYASAYMHELGHTFAFNPIPGHTPFCKYIWQIGWWINRPYRSVMNYAWMYQIVDYSDGSRGSPDIDDWNRIDYDSFEDEWG